MGKNRVIPTRTCSVAFGNSLKVEGTGPWSQQSVFSTSLLVPALRSPENDQTNLSTTLTLTWNTSPGITTYRLQVAIDALFSMLVKEVEIKDEIGSGTVGTSLKLVEATTYYWRVQATNSAGNSDWSEAWHFATGFFPLKWLPQTNGGNPWRVHAAVPGFITRHTISFASIDTGTVVAGRSVWRTTDGGVDLAASNPTR